MNRNEATPRNRRTRFHHRAAMVSIAVIALLFIVSSALFPLPLFVRIIFFVGLLAAGCYFMATTMMVMINKSDRLES